MPCRSSHGPARPRGKSCRHGRKSSKLPCVAIALIVAGMPLLVFMPAAILSLPSSVIIVPLVPLRMAVRVTVGPPSTIPAASTQRHQQGQN